MPEDSMTQALENRIRELTKEKEDLVKQFKPFIDAEFARTLCEWREGEMEKEIAADFRKVVAAVMATGKKGKVTATFTVAWRKGREIRISLVSNPTVPKYGVDDAVAYADETGAMYRSDPNQMELFERRERQDA